MQAVRTVPDVNDVAKPYWAVSVRVRVSFPAVHPSELHPGMGASDKPSKPSPLGAVAIAKLSTGTPSSRAQREKLREQLPASSSRGQRFQAKGEPPSSQQKKKAKKPKPNLAPVAEAYPVNEAGPIKAYPPVEVRIGTHADAKGDPTLANRIASLINEEFGSRRVDAVEIFERLTLAGQSWENRVLHLATRDGALIGVCSSTIQPGWTAAGCGQWGLLAVTSGSRGTGVASALVAAAEARLAAADGCHSIEIEYEYTPGDEFSERLRAWYEGRLSFVCEDEAAHFRRAFRAIAGKEAEAERAGGGGNGGGRAPADPAAPRTAPELARRPSNLARALPRPLQPRASGFLPAPSDAPGSARAAPPPPKWLAPDSDEPPAMDEPAAAAAAVSVPAVAKAPASGAASTLRFVSYSRWPAAAARFSSYADGPAPVPCT